MHALELYVSQLSKKKAFLSFCFIYFRRLLFLHIPLIFISSFFSVLPSFFSLSFLISTFVFLFHISSSSSRSANLLPMSPLVGSASGSKIYIKSSFIIIGHNVLKIGLGGLIGARWWSAASINRKALEKSNKGFGSLGGF